MRFSNFYKVEMSLPWISVNSKLQAGVTLLNALSKTKFNLLLKRIIEAKGEELFTQDELTRLSDSLKLTRDDLELLILTLAHIFKQSSKVILKPTVLQEQLVQSLKFHQEKAEDFVSLWTQETSNDFNLEKSLRLEKVSWELTLQSASSVYNKDVQHKARLQLGLNNAEGNEPKNLILDLNENDLLQFYNVLENVQVKLDSLS